jgi:hypothetical protein
LRSVSGVRAHHLQPDGYFEKQGHRFKHLNSVVRHITGPRIRDKIAASKAKGPWMGGMPPLGYDVVERKLVVTVREAALVRDIFRRDAKQRRLLGFPALDR